MDINDNYIIKTYIDKLGRVIMHKVKNMSQYEIDYLINRFNDSESIKETISRIYYKIYERPKCKYCGKPCRPKNSKFTEYYNSCDNYMCKNKEAYEKHVATFSKNHNGLTNVFQIPNVIEKIQKKKLGKYDEITKKIKQTKFIRYGNEKYNNKEKSKQTCLEKYGVEYSFQSDNNKKKSKQTCLEKYGDENYRNTEKSKQTRLEKYGDENYNNIEQAKQTCLEKYGNENYRNTEKSKQTRLEKYGDETYNNREQAKQTCLEKYGEEYYSKTTEFKEKNKQTCLEKYGEEYYFQTNDYKLKTIKTCLEKYGDETYNNREQAKQTCLEKYGEEYYSKTTEFKNNLSSLYNSGIIQEKSKQTCFKKYGVEHPMQLPEYRNKIYEIKKKNNTFNTSNPEEQCYELLKEKYPDIIRQYKSEKYPYCCDFYIPSLDLYIEFNGSHYHHGHPFNDNNIEDIKELEILKEKDNNSERTKLGKKSQWHNIIYTWTELDVKKRNIAKENKLNYIEFWNIEEVKKWLQN